MKIDRKYIGLLLTLGLMAVIVVKLWPDSNPDRQAALTPPNGPAIILVRGDNSPNCRAIHGLVEQAEARYRGRIKVTQTDWNPDNPLIEQYKIRFLPTVLFIGSSGQEVGRIIGESSTVQDQLAQALNQAETLLAQ